jgi:hypothetical protein
MINIDTLSESEKKFDNNLWEKNNYEMLKKERLSRLKREVKDDEAKKPRENELRALAAVLEEKCNTTVDPLNTLQYRDGLRLMRVGEFLKDNKMKQRGREFCDKCSETLQNYHNNNNRKLDN